MGWSCPSRGASTQGACSFKVAGVEMQGQGQEEEDAARGWRCHGCIVCTERKQVVMAASSAQRENETVKPYKRFQSQRHVNKIGLKL